MKDIVLKLIDTLPSILTAAGVFAGVVLAWRNGKKSDAIKTEAALQAAATLEKTDALKTQGEEIHTLVNGGMAKLKRELAAAVLRNDDLEAQLARRRP